MPAPSLAVDWRYFDSQVMRLNSLLGSLGALSIEHRKLVAEVVLIRLFLLIENTLESVCPKLICGANYLDASVPTRLARARSSDHAIELMRTHGRPRPKNGLSWNSSAEIRDNLGNTLDQRDPLFSHVISYAGLLTDLRYIRNHIAHKNAGTLKNFRKIVRRMYGGLKNGVTPGSLLLTPFFDDTPLLAQHLAASRLFIRTVLRA